MVAIPKGQEAADWIASAWKSVKDAGEWLAVGIGLSPQWIVVLGATLILLGVFTVKLVRAKRG